MNKRIGLLGGSFNPIHNGHLYIAEKAIEQLNLFEVWLLPSGNHPLKGKSNLLKILSIEKRINLIKIAIENNSRLKLSLLDADVNKKSYTYDLMKKLHSLHNDYDFYFIAGSDIVLELPKWYNFEWLLDNINFCIFSRPGFDNVGWKNIEYLNKINFLSIVPLDISSSDIRNKIKSRLSIKNLVPESIRNKVKEYYLSL